MSKRDFLALGDLGAEGLLALLARTAVLKQARQRGQTVHPLRGKILGMIFEKASTRTRVSFEVAVYELGGHAMELAPGSSQLARGEPLRDTARVLGAYCHGLVIRTFGHARAEELARWAPVPVINGLTDLRHPCQVGADLFTVQESRGDLRSLRYAWLGDGNNMAHSWIEAAGLLGLELILACPAGFEPSEAIVAAARQRIASQGRGSITLTEDPVAAVTGADVVSTDVWTSMGQEADAEARTRAFAGYCLDQELLRRAAPDALVLHCLPAHRGEEIAEDVLEGPQSAVWRQAENRLHFQKALLEALMGHDPATTLQTTPDTVPDPELGPGPGPAAPPP
jgi:ornithine carbamoyltransferase